MHLYLLDSFCQLYQPIQIQAGQGNHGLVPNFTCKRMKGDLREGKEDICICHLCCHQFQHSYQISLYLDCVWYEDQSRVPNFSLTVHYGWMPVVAPPFFGPYFACSNRPSMPCLRMLHSYTTLR